MVCPLVLLMKYTNIGAKNASHPVYVRQTPILDSPEHTNQLLKFMASTYCEEMLLFWLDASRYKTLTDQQTLRTEATKIFNNFVDISSTYPINMDIRNL